MDRKNIKVDKNQQIEKISHHSVVCMFLTMAICPVPPSIARAPHNSDL